MTLRDLPLSVEKLLLPSMFMLFFLSVGSAWTGAQPVIIGHDQAHLEDLKDIPAEWIDSAKAKLKVAYFHTSHGSQINSGLAPLDAFMGGKGIYLTGEDGGTGTMYFDDHYGPDLSNREGTFDDETRTFLDDPANGEVNVIIWSWCQIIGHDGDEDPGYCSNMDSLIAEYGPDGSKIKSGVRTVPVQFVYMTGHLNGQGEEGRTNEINNYIRTHCIANERILYDFADIESYDPDDTYFLDDYANDECTYMVNGERIGNWATEWAEGRTMMDGEEDTVHNELNGGQWYHCTPAHTHAVNGNMKAYAAWYLFARLAGWEGPDTAGTTWVTSIEILGEGGNAEISTPQGTLQMTANVTPDDAGDTTIIWSVINGTGQATITQDGLLQAVANGMVTVVATANDGSGVEATLQVTITNQSTGISSYPKPDGKGSIRVFPNPASDHIQVGGDLEFPSFMRIYDMTGQLVREERIESGEQPVDVSGLKQGLFIIRLVGRNTERTAGFMKK
jgi:hypothetical protein